MTEKLKPCPFCGGEAVRVRLRPAPAELLPRMRR